MHLGQGRRQQAEGRNWLAGSVVLPLAICLLPWLAEGQSGAAKAGDLKAALTRVAAYIGDYQVKLAGIVAEETYKQDVRGVNGPRPMSGRLGTTHRDLKSDLLLVRPSGEGPWLQFRDVFEVDGKPLRDRDERLLKLFVDTKVDARGQAESIAQEGARYNIGPVQRTINVPVLALIYFSAEFQNRSRFVRVSPGSLKRFSDVPTTSEIWAIEFKETGEHTLIRGARDADLAAKGRIWVESTSGRVLATELLAEDNLIRAKVETTYGPQQGLDLLVPIAMKEAYIYNYQLVRIFGEASYGRFRQFKVTTDEKTKPPGPAFAPVRFGAARR